MMNKQATDDYNHILNNFDVTDLKYTNEDTSDVGIEYIACIKNHNNAYDEEFNKIISDNFEKDEMGEYIKYTDYGYINISNEDEFINVSVFVNLENVEESNISLMEGGIYPVELVGGADEAFLNVINEILGGDVSEVDNLELIPALGYGGYGRYWYKANITIDEATIVNFISDKSTPEAKRLLDGEKLIINPYSDINIDCSANSVQYQNGITLDTLDETTVDMKALDNDANIIGEEIISKLVEAENKIIEVLKNYEEIEYDDEEFDESIIPIKEHTDGDWDDDELASIYGGDTAQSQKTIEDELDETYLWYGKYTSISKQSRNSSQELVKKVMFKFNSSDFDEANAEFESIIPELYSNCKLMGKLVYGVGSYKQLEKEGFKPIGDIANIESFEDGYDPETDIHGDPDAPYIEMQEPIQYNGFNIYKGVNEYDNEMYYIFFEDDPIPEPGYEERRAKTIDIAKKWCDYYVDPDDEIGIYTGGDPNELDEREFDESIISIKESQADEDDDIYIEEEYYQRNIYDVLDNITALADSYDDAENDEKLKKLGKTIERIEDELDILKKHCMDAVTGIKHIKL